MIDTTKTERLYPITGEMEVADPSKINHGAYYVRASDYDALDAQYKAIVESLRQTALDSPWRAGKEVIMNRHFAIGCMRGGACAFVVGGWVSLCLQIYTGRLVFLWLNIFLLVCVGLISWMGHKLKVEETMPNDKQADRELNAVQVTYGANGVEANCACGWHFHSDSAGAVQWQAAHHTPCSRLQQAAPTPQAQEFAQNQVDLAIDPSSALPIPADFTAQETQGERRYPCPVCDFEMHGPASGYNICPQCGTEFENDDETTSHSELRQRWIDGGRRFWWYEKQHERMNKPQAALKAEKGGNDVTYFNQS
jgi:hypothetical protein